MAKAKVECTCKKCGKVFYKEKECCNRKQADEWEAWMKENYTGLCRDCWKEGEDAKAAEGCDEITMKYSEYKEHYADCRTKAGSYNANDKTIVVFVPTGAEAEAREIKQTAMAEIERGLAEAERAGDADEVAMWHEIKRGYEYTWTKLDAAGIIANREALEVTAFAARLREQRAKK